MQEGMQYELATIEKVLPISGLQVKIQESNGYADRTILKKGRKSLEAFYDYLAHVTVALGDIKHVTLSHILDLLVPDQEFIAVESYKLTYGDMFDFRLTCSACGEASSQEIPLKDLELRDIPAESTGAPDPLLSITLPRTGLRAEIGMLNGNKELEIMTLSMTKGIDTNKSDQCALRSLDGSKEVIYEDVVKLPGQDHKAIRVAREKLICGYDTYVVSTCPSCGNRDRFNMLMHKDFFLPHG